MSVWCGEEGASRRRREASWYSGTLGQGGYLKRLALVCHEIPDELFDALGRGLSARLLAAVPRLAPGWPLAEGDDRGGHLGVHGHQVPNVVPSVLGPLIFVKQAGGSGTEGGRGSGGREEESALLAPRPPFPA